MSDGRGRSPRARSLAARLRGAIGRPALLGLIPAAVLLLCSVSADEVAVTGGDPIGLWRILPAGPVSGDWVTAELSSTALLLLAIALARGKRIGFWLGLAAMAGAIVVQGGVMGHPVAAAGAVAVAVVLVLTHRRYDVATSRTDALVAAALVAGGGLLVGVGAFEAARGSGAAAQVADALAALFDLATPLAVPGLATIAALLLAARVGYVVATVFALDPVTDDRPPEVVAAARRALRTLGAGPLLPYQHDAPCKPVTDAGGRAVLAVATAGRTAVALGDPAGDRDAALRLVESWRAEACRRDLVPAIYQASADIVSSLRRSGWHAYRIGREAVIDPVEFDLGTSRVANLRHTVSRARRGGLTVVSTTDRIAVSDPPLGRALASLDAAWRRRAGPQLGFTVGRFDPDDGRESLLVVAVDADGAPHAFVVLRPTGGDGGWVLDVMRRADGGTPGAVELCMAQAIGVLGGMGVRRLSLGLVPLDGLDPRRGPLPERALAVAARALVPVYDVTGLAFFKHKFDPRWEPRYLVVARWWHLPSVAIALLRLHLGGSWPRVVRSVTAGLVPARGG